MSPPCLHPTSPAGVGLGPTGPRVCSSGERTEVMLGRAEGSSLRHTAGMHRTAQDTSWDTTRGAQHIPGASQHVSWGASHMPVHSARTWGIQQGHEAHPRAQSMSWGASPGTEHIPKGTLRASWGAQWGAGHFLGHGVCAGWHMRALGTSGVLAEAIGGGTGGVPRVHPRCTCPWDAPCAHPSWVIEDGGCLGTRGYRGWGCMGTRGGGTGRM